MGIRTEYQVVVTCDTCGDINTEAYTRQKDARKMFRSYGWKIGKKVTCPKCVKSKS